MANILEWCGDRAGLASAMQGINAAEVADMVVRYYDKFVENEEAYAGTLKKRTAPKRRAKPKPTPAARKAGKR
jgi:hypothetical protein